MCLSRPLMPLHYIMWRPMWFVIDSHTCSVYVYMLPSVKMSISKQQQTVHPHTVYPKKYAHGFCFAVLCCGYTLTDFPISTRLTSLALWQSNDCPSASKATLMNMDKYFMWIHYEPLHNHNKVKHNKTVCIFLKIYCMYAYSYDRYWFAIHRYPNETLLTEYEAQLTT